MLWHSFWDVSTRTKVFWGYNIRPRGCAWDTYIGRVLRPFIFASLLKYISCSMHHVFCIPISLLDTRDDTGVTGVHKHHKLINCHGIFDALLPDSPGGVSFPDFSDASSTFVSQRRMSNTGTARVSCNYSNKTPTRSNRLMMLMDPDPSIKSKRPFVNVFLLDLLLQSLTILLLEIHEYVA